MNEVDRQILSFMRDVENPAQRNFSVGVIDDNVEKNVRKRHLDLLEGRGLVNKSVPDGDSGIENTTYWLSAEGMQAITTSDLDQTLHETNERISQLNSELDETLSTTNERLTETNRELEKLRDSQRDSSAVQTLFILTIITLTYLQARQAVLSALPFWAADGTYLLLMLVGVLLGGQSLTRAIRDRLRV
jgi:predicted RND superfamily exporter protein